MHIEQGLVLDVSGQLQVALTLGRVHLLDGAQLVQARALLRPQPLPLLAHRRQLLLDELPLLPLRLTRPRLPRAHLFGAQLSFSKCEFARGVRGAFDHSRPTNML